MARKIVPAAVVKVTTAPVNRWAPHAEHFGFFAYAACETIGAHWALYTVSVWLAVTGLWVMIARNI